MLSGNFTFIQLFAQTGICTHWRMMSLTQKANHCSLQCMSYFSVYDSKFSRRLLWITHCVLCVCLYIYTTQALGHPINRSSMSKACWIGKSYRINVRSLYSQQVPMTGIWTQVLTVASPALYPNLSYFICELYNIFKNWSRIRLPTTCVHNISTYLCRLSKPWYMHALLGPIQVSIYLYTHGVSYNIFSLHSKRSGAHFSDSITKSKLTLLRQNYIYSQGYPCIRVDPLWSLSLACIGGGRNSPSSELADSFLTSPAIPALDFRFSVCSFWASMYALRTLASRDSHSSSTDYRMLTGNFIRQSFDTRVILANLDDSDHEFSPD